MVSEGFYFSFLICLLKFDFSLRRYMILSREIFNPNYVLFTAAADGATFQPNPLSMINNNHLDYFKFVGRVIGKAICDGQLMDAHFTR
jgi:E3 ubiquitin-protein ligase HUWE1